MTPDQLYEQIIELAVSMARVTTREKLIIGDVWKPIALPYESMIYRKEIKPIADLPEDEKRKYFDETEGIRFTQSEIFKRKIVSQALYMYDLLMKDL